MALATASLGILAAFGDAPWRHEAVLGLALLKLYLLWSIARNTHRAKHEHWNDRAVDYRYLAERLRALLYLPTCGAYQPPAAAPAQHAERQVHQSAVDWLCDALARGVSPATPQAGTEPITDPGPRRLALDPGAALTELRSQWISKQIEYHRDNARLMGRLEGFAERAGTGLSQAVVWLVAFDIALLITYIALKLALAHPPHWLEALEHYAAPVLIFFTAMLPAAVASFNGLRFQGETRRLAERSKHLVRVLTGRGLEAAALAERLAKARGKPAEDCQSNDPGAWSLETLRLAERVADDCVREVADWQVLYAKELPET